MKQKILLHLDTDPLASTFDRIVAIDAGVDVLLSHPLVTPENLTPIVHGAIFTRGPDDLKSTAIFIGGSDINAGQKLLDKIQTLFFADRRVSVMLDSNGSNTTATAAVLCAARHMSLKTVRALVLGGTGPVGLRVCQLLAREGAQVMLASRELERAETAVAQVHGALPTDEISSTAITAVSTQNMPAGDLLKEVDLLISAGSAGVSMIDEKTWSSATALKVAIDLNAVPPSGIEGITPTDNGADHHAKVCYGALGVGGLKMKIHRAALQDLFHDNTHILETFSLYEFASKTLSS